MPHRGNGYCFYSFNDMDLKIDIDDATNCILGNKDKKVRTLVFGDSFAGHLDPLLDVFFSNNLASFRSVSTNWCYPSFSKGFVGPETHQAFSQCELNRQYLYNALINKDYDNLILAGNWHDLIVEEENHIDDFIDVINLAIKQNIKVLVMPIPHRYKNSINPISFWSRQFVLKEQSPDLSQLIKLTPANVLLAEKLKELDVIFLKQNEVFAPEGMFEYSGVEVPYTLDGRHISLLGSQNAFKYFSRTERYGELVKYLKLN